MISYDKTKRLLVVHAKSFITLTFVWFTFEVKCVYLGNKLSYGFVSVYRGVPRNASPQAATNGGNFHLSFFFLL